jgi:hypothetical protein
MADAAGKARRRRRLDDHEVEADGKVRQDPAIGKPTGPDDPADAGAEVAELAPIDGLLGQPERA